MTVEVIGGAGGVRRRHPVNPATRRMVSVVWLATVPVGAESCRILPDAHIDLVWNGDRLQVAGPDTTARVEVLPPGGAVLGFQLAPGAARTMFGVPASALVDDRVDLTELWGAALVEPLVEALQAAADPGEAANLIEAAIAPRLGIAEAVDELVAEVRRRLSRGVPIRHLDDLGLGERQLRRRCVAGLGYGPKVLARVLRFQAFLDRLHAQPGVGLAVAAADVGYADQAHLTHDIVTLAGLTPARLRARLRSDSDKTRAA